MWFETIDGLNLFNGHNFAIFIATLKIKTNFINSPITAIKNTDGNKADDFFYTNY